MANKTGATFIDFDLRILRADPSTYLVTAQTPDSGLANSILNFGPLSNPDFVALLERIREEPFTTDQAFFERVGEGLFEALFRGQVRDLFISVYAERVQPHADTYLRIRMDIDETASEIAMLPWEFMRWRDVYLSTQTKTLVTRQLLNLDYGKIQSLTVTGKPRVLIVIPRGSGLATAEEEASISTALTRAGIPFDILNGKVTVLDVADTLAAGEHSVMHFIGHGEFDFGHDGQYHGSLRFNSAQPHVEEYEDETWVEDTRLRTLFSPFENLKLVVLNACHGAEVTEKRTGRGFIGTAPAILKAGVPAVVAMQYAIRDDVAVQFAETLYKRLTTGRWAGQIDTCVTLARNACFLTFPDDRGFATPILYLRSKDGVIFNIEEGRQQPPKPSDSLLHEYRHYDATTMAQLVNAAQDKLLKLQQDVQSIQPESIDALVADAEVGIDVGVALIEENEVKQAQEVDNLLAVYQWKMYQLSRSRADLKRSLAALQVQRDHLARPGIEREIFQKERALQTIELQLAEAEKALRNGAGPRGSGLPRGGSTTPGPAPQTKRPRMDGDEGV